jgi:Ca2+-binding RTX toxin-like protein
LLDFLYGGVGNDALAGGHRQTFLSGQAGNDTLSGGDGPDTLWGGSGDDHLGGGGAGGDRVVFVGDRGSIQVNLATGRAQGDGSDTISSASGVLVLRTPADARIVGDGASNLLVSWSGDDVIQARGGRDFVLPQTGADDVVLGGGNDFTDTKDSVRGNDSTSGGPGNDTCLHDAKDTRRSCERPIGEAPASLARTMTVVLQAVKAA